MSLERRPAARPPSDPASGAPPGAAASSSPDARPGPAPVARGPVLEPRVLPPAIRYSLDERDRIARALREGQLERVRRGVYVPAPVEPTEQWQRREAELLAALRGVAERLTTQWWFSHTSAAFLWGCWVYPLRHEVHTLQLYNPKIVKEHDPNVRRHWTKRPERNGVEIDGVPVTSLERTAVDCARLLPERAAMPIVDSAFRIGIDQRRLARVLAEAAGGRGVRRARRVLGLADARSESPGESVTRWIIHEFNLPAPELAIRVVTAQGEHWLDLGWPELRVGIEFDGAVKYSGGEYGDPRSTLIAEKRRHDALVEAGWLMLRVMTVDHRDPERLAARIRGALNTAARRRDVGPSAPSSAAASLPRGARHYLGGGEER